MAEAEQPLQGIECTSDASENAIQLNREVTGGEYLGVPTKYSVEDCSVLDIGINGNSPVRRPETGAGG